jgi:hypothetical protein
VHLHGNLLLRDAWVWPSLPLGGTTANTLVFVAGGIAGIIGNPGGTLVTLIFGDRCIDMLLSLQRLSWYATLLFPEYDQLTPSQVRLQGDFAKPPEKRFNYKHCFDALFRVCDTLNLMLLKLS